MYRVLCRTLVLSDVAKKANRHEKVTGKILFLQIKRKCGIKLLKYHHISKNKREVGVKLGWNNTGDVSFNKIVHAQNL